MLVIARSCRCVHRSHQISPSTTFKTTNPFIIHIAFTASLSKLHSDIPRSKMKSAALIATAASLAVSSAAPMIPAAHQARFLQDRPALEAELAAWKMSAAGQTALHNGFYVEDPHESTKSNDEHLTRFFLTKLAIEAAQKRNPKAVFSVDSPFTLMTSEEFSQYVKRGSRGAKPTALHAPGVPVKKHESHPVVGAGRDWSPTKCLPPVKDQGNCGSCWAFSAVGALESAFCIKHNYLVPFSEQEIVSCDEQDSGCKSGFPSQALSFVQSNGGISTEQSYPYISGNTDRDESCNMTSRSKLSIKISAVVTVPISEAAYISAIRKQPVTVLVNSDNDAWKQYTSGVVTDCIMDVNDLDHAVLAVGYDSSSYKIRNSWGPDWGDHGYIHLARINETAAACGMINEYAAYPTLD